MRIRLLELIEGAEAAEGLTVIIDAFRAYSVEACLFAQGASRIHPVGEVEKAMALKEEHPDWVLFGERKGEKLPGFEFGNSPSSIEGLDFTGKTVIHTTSAGTQGAVHARGASELLATGFLTAGAVAAYIKKKEPRVVSVVALGKAGTARADEDWYCAEYIESLLLGKPYDLAERFADLRLHGGAHFFDPSKQAVFPQRDFEICTMADRFDFVIRITEEDGLLTAEKCR